MFSISRPTLPVAPTTATLKPMICFLLWLVGLFPGSWRPVTGLCPPLPPGRGPGSEDKRQRVVPPLAAGVLVAGLVVDARVIATARVLMPPKCPSRLKSQLNPVNEAHSV